MPLDLCTTGSDLHWLTKQIVKGVAALFLTRSIGGEECAMSNANNQTNNFEINNNNKKTLRHFGA
jgi:hypothetical protein